MTGILEDEQRLIQARVELTRQLDRGTVVLSSRLAEAFLNVPRHTFVPAFYRRDGETFVPWRSTDADPDAWLAHVYSDDSLITEVDGVHAEQAGPQGLTGVPTSSSTAPSLMGDMLDALDVSRGAHLLEIGTGTGYNAALLSWLAGHRNVTTVDRSGTLVDTARTRLKEIGLHPSVIHTDGAKGCADRAPFDRIIATCSVRRIPTSWLEQCAPGGILVVPIKGTLAGGMVTWLKKLPDGTAAGHVLHTPAAFMPLLSGQQQRWEVPKPGGDSHRRSGISGSVLDDWTFSFFAQLHLPPETVRSFTRREGLHITTLFDPTDGSCTRVEDDGDGRSAITMAGPRDLWALVENAYARWLELNRPRREWFTIHVTSADQWVAHTAPDGRVHRWPLR